ncbi:MAG: 23S rRNA (adenine(2503)-C(2))-methyltransferase RlmN [Candidatus Omnitrophica bacterium]|jgi:23S rRNA (adenine2503-C2)-methyltransferase|nr:23S rRNA (adenine(2503)-C(2))-methyltransferase RlmN [Candidatus Omnitrophota bacterium]MDD5137811.1 23S rRNA (adenine(2503)-C(2))-methyltransferase RlmN [Candidatus Omnitrophota bacterium]MDD5538511.1 23S rRNA (adenine(2503)-C(2))-methyltransferase RlmN [Candidatus Omnitrophota bacterium]
MVEDIRNITLGELEKNLCAGGFPAYRARQVFAWLYKKGVEDFAAMANLPQDLKVFLKTYYAIQPPAVEKILTSSDLTQKFLLRLKDRSLIESVSIPAKSRLTACLSTQVGCRYSCAFCASGTAGFRRHLDAGEILGQFLTIARNVPEGHISNVVFMGIGEPLDNYENLMRAIRILNDEHGVRLGARKMTISTCGLAPAIERLSREKLQLELSVSLHAATDEKRSQLLPVNKRFPLETLMRALRVYVQATKRKITFEYVLLRAFNTTVDDAQALIALIRGLNARVNLIPFNPAVSRMGFEPPVKLEVLFFKSYLEKHGVDVTLRLPRGSDISAACGQLRYQTLRGEKEHGA